MLLLVVSYLLGLYAFYFDHGVEVYSIISPEDPQELCFCDTNCECTCNNLTLPDTDLNRVMACHLSVERALAPYSTVADMHAATVNGSLDRSFLTAECAPVVRRMDAQCLEFMEVFGAKLAPVFPDFLPWDITNGTQWKLMFMYLSWCLATTFFNRDAENIDFAPCGTPPRESLLFLLNQENPEFDGMPGLWGCSYVCIFVQFFPSWALDLGSLIPNSTHMCAEPPATMNPVGTSPWTTMQALWYAQTHDARTLMRPVTTRGRVLPRCSWRGGVLAPKEHVQSISRCTRGRGDFGWGKLRHPQNLVPCVQVWEPLSLGYTIVHKIILLDAHDKQ